jgi:hypothetical protein
MTILDNLLNLITQGAPVHSVIHGVLTDCQAIPR